MTKHINFKSAKNIAIIGLVALALHYGLLYFLQMTSIWLWAFYLYFMVAAIAVGAFMNYYNTSKPDRMGLMFIVSIFVKMLLFTAVFSPLLFSGTPLEMSQKLEVLLPFALFLVLEVLEIMKLLKIQG
jgi:hypothetical protein